MEQNGSSNGTNASMSNNAESKKDVIVEINLNTSDSLMCRICHEGEEEGRLFSPCKCSGTMKFVHENCLDKWRALSSNPQSFFICDNCKYHYNLYRPKLSKLLQSEVIISGMTGIGMCILTLGRWAALFLFNTFNFTNSGSSIITISGEKWEFKNATFYGLIM
jgi:E3 ubiquitin-protein ligase DOA10